MNNSVVEAITRRFVLVGNPAQVPLLRYSQRGKTIFKAHLTNDGIFVDNLPHANSLLPWEVFVETVKLLEGQGGSARKGSSVYKLGSEQLPLDSIEGHIAHVVFNKQVGETVLRRISPITGILRWARICESKPGKLVLK